LLYPVINPCWLLFAISDNPEHLCSPFNKGALISFYETYLPAFQEEKKEQARFPRAHGICEWTQSVGKPQKKWQKEADSF
jgi:hypothetical protein